MGCYYITTQHPFVPTQITGLATSCLAWLLYPLETYCNPTPLRHSFNFDIWLMMNRIRNSDENPPDDGSDPRYNGISSSWIISCNRGHYKTRDWVIETTIQTLAFMLPTDVLITTDKRRTDCMVVACSCFQSFDGSAAQEHPCLVPRAAGGRHIGEAMHDCRRKRGARPAGARRRAPCCRRRQSLGSTY